MNLQYLLSITIIVIISLIINRKLKNDSFNQMILIVTLIITFVGITVYYLYNNKWDTFFIEFSQTVISCLLSGGILITVTLGQIERAEEENKIKAHEEQRINCLPLLSYTIKKVHNNILNIKIKNIGNQAIRKYNVIINGRSIIPNTIHNCLAINEEANLNHKVKFDDNANTKSTETITITVRYQDIICNKYQQKINIFYYRNDKTFTIDKITISDEQLIKDNQINE